MKNTLPLAVLLSTLASLSACGGGDGPALAPAPAPALAPAAAQSLAGDVFLWENCAPDAQPPVRTFARVQADGPDQLTVRRGAVTYAGPGCNGAARFDPSSLTDVEARESLQVAGEFDGIAVYRATPQPLWGAASTRTLLLRRSDGWRCEDDAPPPSSAGAAAQRFQALLDRPANGSPYPCRAPFTVPTAGDWPPMLAVGSGPVSADRYLGRWSDGRCSRGGLGFGPYVRGERRISRSESGRLRVEEGTFAYGSDSRCSGTSTDGVPMRVRVVALQPDRTVADLSVNTWQAWWQPAPEPHQLGAWFMPDADTLCQTVTDTLASAEQSPPSDAVVASAITGQRTSAAPGGPWGFCFKRLKD